MFLTGFGIGFVVGIVFMFYVMAEIRQGVGGMMKEANHDTHDCYWKHDKEHTCWFTSCDRAFFVSGPCWHNCPRCGGFIVIDYYGEYVKEDGQGATLAE